MVQSKLHEPSPPPVEATPTPEQEVTKVNGEAKSETRQKPVEEPVKQEKAEVTKEDTDTTVTESQEQSKGKEKETEQQEKTTEVSQLVVVWRYC